MNSTELGSPLAGPRLYCRPALWTDVAKFFILNYGLHAFTVVSRPGAGPLITIVDGLSAVLLPLSSTRSAIVKLSRFSILKKNKLARAADAGALCMLVPASVKFGKLISPSLTNIHGHHPINRLDLVDWVKHKVFGLLQPSNEPAPGQPNEVGIDGKAYKLVSVPLSWNIAPLSSLCCGKGCNLDIASNYSILKTSAAIIQILYGSYELYAAAVRSVQFDRFGYAAYSLTVIPYTLMSFLNGLASLSRPAYPALYLVYYTGYDRTATQGNIIGQTNPSPPEGQGEVQDCPQVTAEKTCCSENIRIEVDGTCTEDIGTDIRDELTEDQMGLIMQAPLAMVGAVGRTCGVPKYVPPSTKTGAFTTALFMIAIAAPYVIIYLFTGYDAGQSTQAQRIWITSSMVLNQIFWALPFCIPAIRPIVYPPQVITEVPAGGGGGLATRIRIWLDCPDHALLGLFLYTMVMSVPTIGSFVVVGNMMLNDQVCVKLA